MGGQRKIWVMVVVLAGCGVGLGQAVPAGGAGGAGEVQSRDVAVRKAMEEDIKEIAADGVGLGKLLRFLGDNSRVEFAVDWEGLGKVGVDENSGVEMAVKEVPLRRALTEALDQVSGGKATFWVEEGKVKIGVKDQTAAEKKKRAAALIVRARELAGQPRVAADLLIQARVMDGAGDEKLLQQMMGQVKESGWSEAFSADGSVVLKAAFSEKEQELRKETLKELTAEGQRLVKIVYFVTSTMEINRSVDWAALEKAGASRDVPVTVKVKEATLDATLGAVLEKAGGGKLGMADNDGLLTISTVEELEKSPRYQCVWAYDVRGVKGETVVAGVKAAVGEKGWGNGCYAEVSGGVLFVRQTWENQRKVAGAVEKMRGIKVP